MDLIRILIADDHSLVREGIRNVLESYEDIIIVGEAWDGPSLFSLIKQTKPELILIDVTMPNFDPISAVREIRMIYPDIKILVISAYDDDMYVKGLMAAGADGYHLKEQPLPQFKMAIDQILAGQKWIASPLINKLVSPILQKASIPSLTTRQVDLLRLLQQGLDNQSIALKLGLSVKTVENNLTRLYRFLNIQSRLEAVNYASQHPEIFSNNEQETDTIEFEYEYQNPAEVKLLLVDDNNRYRRELRQTVNIIFPRAMIYEAENSSEALYLTEHFAPNLILVDVLLGKENGIQCTKLIKKKMSQSKIILISAYPDREFHRLGLEAGALAFLDKKDLDTSSLRQIIYDFLP